MKVHSSALIVLSLSGVSLAKEYGQWGVYAYTDRNCNKLLGQWRDDKLPQCTSLANYPDVLGIRVDVKHLGPMKCGWVVKTYSSPDCSGDGREITRSNVCVDTPFFADFKKPVKSFIVGQFPVCE
ncbi:hypothetical protein BFJ72_g3997 [Fusarium proliferatum]|uniref:Ecp2 effector protein domain-containing protein n=1 Tax=Gibberella intermedia TaxID=948311 RepID=A0A420TS40_GIBIN|nr:hypothetical protein BFJ72_g3997 [Fusarium proliferatum]